MVVANIVRMSLYLELEFGRAGHEREHAFQNRAGLGLERGLVEIEQHAGLTPSLR